MTPDESTNLPRYQHPRLTAADERAILDDYRSAVPRALICRRHGIANATLTNVLNRNAEPRRRLIHHPYCTSVDPIREEVCASFCRGEHPKDIAARIQISLSSLYRILRQAQIDPFQIPPNRTRPFSPAGGKLKRLTVIIPAFPEEIDRSAFGHYLSGLVDGEGYFHIGWQKPRRKRRYFVAALKIGLRADDRAILELIQSFLGCGNIHSFSRSGNRGDVAVFDVGAVGDLAEIVIPHFDRYPLRAKKRHNYLLWREAVLLLHANHIRGGRFSSCKNPPKYNPEEVQRFDELIAQIKALRPYCREDS